MKLSTSSTVLVLSLAFFSQSSAPQTLVLEQINLSFYTASAAVVKEVLDRLRRSWRVSERSSEVTGRIPLATELEGEMMVENTPAEEIAQEWMAAKPTTVDAWFQRSSDD